MKASELLRRYQAGETKFQRVNLRGQSFKGQNLAGIDFSQADLRGTNFTGANLRGADFYGAQCGLQKRWTIILLLLSWLIAGGAGLVSFLPMSLVFKIFESSSLDYQIAGWTSLIVLVLFWIFLIRSGLRTLALLVAVVGAIVGAIVGAGGGAVAGVGAVVFTVGFTVAITFIVAFAIAIAFTMAGIVAGLVAFTVAGVFALAEVVAGAVAFAVAGIGAGVVGIYMGWRAIKGDERDTWVRSVGIAWAATGGTSFRGADLTDADFTEARLKSTDFREANLSGVSWEGAKSLELVRLES